jgi:hypothetical protein
MKTRLARAGVVGAMAVGAVVAVTSFGVPGGAQTDATTTITNPGFDETPDVSHDGSKIVFVSSLNVDGSESSLSLHDRGTLTADGTVLPATTTPIVDSLGAMNPAISGNGCIVTWSVPAVGIVVEPSTDPEAAPGDETSVDPADEPTDGGTVSVPEPVVDTIVAEVAGLQSAPPRMVVLDRCADPALNPEGLRVDLPLEEGDELFGRAATSVDGSVIAVSNGTDVVRFELATGGGYLETSRFDGSDADGTDHLVDDRVDVSDDGSVIVFSGGLDLADISLMTVFAHVVAAEAATTTTPVLTSATAPSVSGDGTLIVGSTGADASSVSLVERTAAPLVPIDLGPGRRPAISADGNHVVFEEGANLAIVSRTGQGEAPFDATQRTLLSTTITPTRSGPVIDRLGTTVISDRGFDPQAPPDDTDISVTVVDADASFDAAMFDLGTGDVGAVLTSTVTFSNRGPASVGVASITVDGTFAISADRCGSVVRPGTTCAVDVSFVVERLQDAFGVVTLTPTSFGVTAFTTEVTALGEAAPVSTTSTTTTTPGSTTGGATTGSTSSTGGTTSSTGGSSATSTTTTTTVVPGAGVSASPSSFDFVPTIIDAGRRTGLVEIVNNGSGAATIVGVRLDPAEAGPFQVVETTCAGESVAAGERCRVTLSFAPTATGDQGVSLIASIEGGTDITVAVTGTGAPAPVVAVVPGVATVGQVVTLSGAGFPTGITVDVTWASTVTQIVVDEAGTFNLPVVVMSHTRSGPAVASVAGQTDLFGTATGTMLVTATSDRSSPAVLDGVGINVGR